MDQVLKRIYSIANHPINKLDEKFRLKYVKGLAACLHLLSKDSPKAKFIFNIWAKSILSSDSNLLQYWHDDIVAIKSALSIQRNGFKFFSMKLNLFFDCFYLLEACNLCPKQISQTEIYQLLNTTICNLFTRGALNMVYQDFQGLIVNNASYKKKMANLVIHREKNRQILKVSNRRILVVANVSAGKSTLINALVGYRLNRMKTTACTNKIVHIYNKVEPDGIIKCNEANNYAYYGDPEMTNSDYFIACALHFHSLLSRSNICLVDSPGINNADNLQHKAITLQAIRQGEYDALLYVSNCQYFGTNDEHLLLNMLQRTVKKPILFVLNQLDRFKSKQDSVAEMLNNYRQDLRQIGFKDPVVIPVSARAALLMKLSDNRLDEDDLFDKEQYVKQFKRDYFDLPAYVNGDSTSNLLERTGISYLEEMIKQTI